ARSHTSAICSETNTTIAVIIPMISHSASLVSAVANVPAAAKMTESSHDTALPKWMVCPDWFTAPLGADSFFGALSGGVTTTGMMTSTSVVFARDVRDCGEKFVRSEAERARLT